MNHASIPRLILNIGYNKYGRSNSGRRDRHPTHLNDCGVKVPFDCDLDKDSDVLKLHRWIAQRRPDWNMTGYSPVKPTNEINPSNMQS